MRPRKELFSAGDDRGITYGYPFEAIPTKPQGNLAGQTDSNVLNQDTSLFALLGRARMTVSVTIQ